MPRKEFVAFTRLDASDVNDFLMDQSVMSFADSSARGAAIPTPVEGMVSYLEDIDDLRTYNGSAWVSPYGMTHLKTVTFTTVSSITFGNNTMTSEFNNYKIIGRFNATNTTVVNMRLRAAGTSSSAANYQQFGFGWSTADNNSNTTFGAGNQTSSRLFTPATSANQAGMEMTLVGPALATRTPYFGQASAATDNIFAFALINFGGAFAAATAFDDVEFFPGTGTLTGEVSIYGIRK
jgi:hypothetical protein